MSSPPMFPTPPFLTLLLLFLATVISSAPPIQAGLPSASPAAERTAPITRIAFGSCANQSSPQPIWDAINRFDPHLFIWMGDNIYGDNRRPFRIFGRERTIGPWKNVPRFYPSSEEELRKKYALAKNNPGYSALRNKVKVVGTWDDHDFGLNDAGKEFDGKNMTQRLMLDFLDEPIDSSRRKQAGVYTSYLFGPVGKSIKVIVLDTRYHRDPLSSDGTILGDLQWTWLEKELHDSPSKITIIVSSIQVIPNISAVTGPIFRLEAWGRFPKERERLFKLIEKSKRNGVLFISGDVHYGEITRYDCGCGYPLYDITSSGLTQAVEKAVPYPLALIVRIAALLTPTTMRVYGPKCRRRSCTYGEPNFGAIEIDWDTTPKTMKVELRDVDGNPVSGVDILLSDLQPKNTGAVDPVIQHQYCSLETNLPWATRHRLAILFFCTIAVFILALAVLTFAVVSIGKKCYKKFKLD